jgi:hypothetical protein
MRRLGMLNMCNGQQSKEKTQSHKIDASGLLCRTARYSSLYDEELFASLPAFDVASSDKCPKTPELIHYSIPG